MVQAGAGPGPIVPLQEATFHDTGQLGDGRPRQARAGAAGGQPAQDVTIVPALHLGHEG